MFLTFLPLLSDAANRFGRHWRRAARSGDRASHTNGQRVGRVGGLRVERIDDPEGTSRIVRIVGTLSPSALPWVFDAWSDATAPHLVHIDVTDAVIADPSTMWAFERAIDHLERRQIDIRISGLDPSHPALTG